MGIVWTLDEMNHIIIDRIEALSPASAIPSLVRGIRLLRINTLETKVLPISITTSTTTYNNIVTMM